MWLPDSVEYVSQKLPWKVFPIVDLALVMNKLLCIK